MPLDSKARSDVFDYAQNIDDDNELINKKIVSTPKAKREIGIDTDDTFYEEIIDAGENNYLDTAKLESFSKVSKDRNSIYNLIDDMAADATISTVLTIYSDDTTATNDEGKAMWATSDDSNIAKFVNYLLDCWNVEKNIYQWANSLIKYGDLYLRLYRESDIKNDLFDNDDKHIKEESKSLREEFDDTFIDEENIGQDSLNEEVRINAYKMKADPYVNYIEAISNPAEVFELTKFGKSQAYIKTKAPLNELQKDNTFNDFLYKYSFDKNDVDIFQPIMFVHACLQDDVSRTPEEVELFLNRDTDSSKSSSVNYTVKRGKSILYDSFKIWRQMQLLENSMLLNRITKSSTVRIVQVECQDMPKEKVGQKLLKVKQQFEQKSALNVNQSISEYTNPGPMENNIYVPVHNGAGSITTQELGGDPSTKGLDDVEYFKDKLLGSLAIPKQFLGDTDDSTGFNGGTSLSLISSRYAKTIKRIQNALVCAIEDAVNLNLLDKGLNNYIGKFQLHMQAPVTQEDVDRADTESQKIGKIGDILNILGDIETPSTRLKIANVLLTDAIHNQELTSIVEKEIESMQAIETVTEENALSDIESSGLPSSGMDLGSGGSDFDFGDEESDIGGEEEGGEPSLPTPAELDSSQDFSDANMEIEA